MSLYGSCEVLLKATKRDASRGRGLFAERDTVQRGPCVHAAQLYLQARWIDSFNGAMETSLSKKEEEHDVPARGAVPHFEAAEMRNYVKAMSRATLLSIGGFELLLGEPPSSHGVLSAK